MSYFSASIGLTDEQKQMQSVALDFAKQEMLPNMAKWDIEVNNIQCVFCNKRIDL